MTHISRVINNVFFTKVLPNFMNPYVTIVNTNEI